MMTVQRVRPTQVPIVRRTVAVPFWLPAVMFQLFVLPVMKRTRAKR